MMRRVRFVRILTLVLISSVSARAAEGDKTALTIYSTAQPGGIPAELYRPGQTQSPYGYNPHQPVPGYAVIRQERAMDVPRGVGLVRFTDVASMIDPTTVTFASLTDPAGTSVLDQNYQFDLVSPQKLMERYLDRKITVEQQQGDKLTSYTGTLLSAASGLILKGDDGRVQVFSNYSNVLFPDLPGGLITKPTLVWNVAAAKGGKHQTRVTYQTGGITWWADYNLIFTEGKNANSGVLDVGAWVSIVNKSGATYPEAKLKLIAGDVHRAPQPQQTWSMPTARAMNEAKDAAAGFEEKAFFEYHLYTLGRPTTIPDNSTQQIELFPAVREVPCEKVMVYYGNIGSWSFLPNPATDRNFGTQMNKKVDIYLKFKNEKERGMGMPLPSGRIRVSKRDPADDSLEFIGEDVIDHTPKNEDVLVKLGSAFDVVGERRQVDFRIDAARDWMEEDIEIKIRNHKDEPIKVIVKENLYRWVNWEIKKKSHDFEKIDSRTVHFPIEVAKDGEVVVTYTVRYWW